MPQLSTLLNAVTDEHLSEEYIEQLLKDVGAVTVGTPGHYSPVHTPQSEESMSFYASSYETAPDYIEIPRPNPSVHGNLPAASTSNKKSAAHPRTQSPAASAASPEDLAARLESVCSISQGSPPKGAIMFNKALGDMELDAPTKRRIRETIPAEKRWYRVTWGEVVGAIQGWYACSVRFVFRTMLTGQQGWIQGYHFWHKPQLSVPGSQSARRDRFVSTLCDKPQRENSLRVRCSRGHSTI